MVLPSVDASQLSKLANPPTRITNWPVFSPLMKPADRRPAGAFMGNAATMLVFDGDAMLFVGSEAWPAIRSSNTAPLIRRAPRPPDNEVALDGGRAAGRRVQHQPGPSLSEPMMSRVWMVKPRQLVAFLGSRTTTLYLRTVVPSWMVEGIFAPLPMTPHSCLVEAPCTTSTVLSTLTSVVGSSTAMACASAAAWRTA